jgi:glycosyltransferase involved in cell wall biosynthesis
VAELTHRETIAGLVSVNMPFFNTRESFLVEAIESVKTQTYDSWELILIDDGSDRPLSDFAKDFAATHLGKIRYLEHDQHRNLGISASRNLGLSAARGEFIAFLDADDVWGEHQLEEQVELLRDHPGVGMVFGNTLYWSSWPGSTRESKLDRVYDLILRTPRLVTPPNMLRYYLEGRSITPCMTGVVVRRGVIEDGVLFEEDFTGHYEDQVFLAKVWANYSVYVVDRLWGKYRQHSDSVTADGDDSLVASEWRLKYLRWLSQYLTENNLQRTSVWRALRLQLLMSQYEWIRRSVLMWREIRRLCHKKARQMWSRVGAA